MANRADWGLEADVVVLGSGGAALTAAISAYDFGAKDVVILERSGMVGGTTAMSGGMLWIPNNHHQHEIGVAWRSAIDEFNEHRFAFDVEDLLGAWRIE